MEQPLKPGDKIWFVYTYDLWDYLATVFMDAVIHRVELHNEYVVYLEKPLGGYSFMQSHLGELVRK